MTLSPDDVCELAKTRLLPAFWKEKERLDRLDRWCRWTMDDAQLPRTASPELRRLVQLAKTPWLGLVVTTTAQCMYVDGYRSPTDPDPATPWKTWQANDFDTRQIPVHRATLQYGTAYVTVLHGQVNGQRRSVMRGVSPRQMMCFYDSPGEDDWPEYALRVEPAPVGWAVEVWDNQDIHELTLDSEGDGTLTYIGFRSHGCGETPVVRYANLDLEGRATGDVEPFIPVAARINKTSLDRLTVQHFGSWKVRTIAGLVSPDDPEEASAMKLRLRQQDILTAEDPDTKFGTLDETPLDGFIAAWESDIEALAAVTQMPTHNLTGQMVNLSAEALAAARASLNQKVTEWQKALGKSHDQALRFAAGLEGDDEAANDFEAHCTWQDMEIRSMSQAVDALGKASQMLHVPEQALWSRIPGVTDSDITQWKRMAEEADTAGQLMGMLNRQNTPAPLGTVVQQGLNGASESVQPRAR